MKFNYLERSFKQLYRYARRDISLFAVAVLCSLFVFDTDVTYSSTSSPWSMFHHDAQHTGQSAYNGPQTNTLKWSYKSSSTSSDVPPNTPSISNDGLTIYSNFDSSQLLALNVDNGQLRWSATIGGGGATAVATDGTVYAVAGTSLYALTSTGSTRWTFSEATENIYGEPCIGGDGTIYIGSRDTYVYAVNPDGTRKWKYKTAGSIAPLASPTLSPDGLSVYVGAGDPHSQTDGTLYALNSSDGTLKWSKKIDSTRVSGAVVGPDGTIYVSGNGRVNAFQSDGTQLWQSADGTAEYLTPALSSSGIIYTGTGRYGKVYALNSSTGATLWSYQTGTNPDSSGTQYGVLTAPVIGADATVYVGAIDGKMYALKSDGTLLWTYSTSASIAENCPAIGADGTLYFSSSNTYLYAVKDSSSGSSTTTTTATVVSTTTSTTTTTVNATTIISNSRSTVTYSLPYLHTNTSNVTYCEISNVSTDSVTGLYFAMGANSSGTPTSALKEFSTTTLYGKMSKMMTFSGNNVYFGNDTADLSSELSSASSYGGTLTFYSSNTGLNCKSVVLSCFQGTTSPRRNLAGLVCEDNSTIGPGGKNILTGF
ncbi:MAG: PQQ-like beta-propeller repeat protein [Nitrospirae bacterium]|nr:PQQ-like beta-propeller repeat protein [Nitrospirota bacterium]MBF0534759.1 PQQ-like beta-propeller repeat protein [Nitrospirota bacterium]MBF0616433.1 PQQ-like beta-propeller repeat protein [Nitrospirota bacterium]